MLYPCSHWVAALVSPKETGDLSQTEERTKGKLCGLDSFLQGHYRVKYQVINSVRKEGTDTISADPRILKMSLLARTFKV